MPPAKRRRTIRLLGLLSVLCLSASQAEDWHRQYDAPRTQREEIFAFTQKPSVRFLGNDKYEIAFAVKGACDVAASLIDSKGKIVRHLGAGVLGPNAPAPFQKGALSQKILWNGKDDLGAYVREPEKLRARICLGLKPVFERLLGDSDPRNLPGKVFGFAVGPQGVYVFSKARMVFVRKFGHDAKYIQSLIPPPSNLPESRLGGRTTIEYEPGKRSHHGPFIMEDMGFNGNPVPGLDDDDIQALQSVVVEGRLYFCTGGSDMHRKRPSRLHYLNQDGSTEVRGLGGRPFLTGEGRHTNQRFAASPDGQWIYMVGLTKGRENAPVVMRIATAGNEPAQPFIGKVQGKGRQRSFPPSSGNDGFNHPTGIDTDAKGRLYIADQRNNRIQVFSPEGQYLKSIPLLGVSTVQVHKKNGAIYALHRATDHGRSIGRLTKLNAFENPTPAFHMNNIHAKTFVLDSWTAPPTLWMNGGLQKISPHEKPGSMDNVTVWKETGKTWKNIMDFNAESKKTAGKNYSGRWSAGVFDHVDCDPVREHLYFRAFRSNPTVFDLRSGNRITQVRLPGPMNDIAFDKRGYMHAHFDPGFYMPGVARFDPDQKSVATDYYQGNVFRTHPHLKEYKEVPYNYGIALQRPQKRGVRGGLSVKDQPGAKFFQDGFDVDMTGNLAVESNIYYIPKMSEASFEAAYVGPKTRKARGGTWFTDRDPYTEFVKKIKEQQKRGEEIYAIPRRPGIPLAAGTVWTFEASGELREECAVIAHKLIIGLQMDAEGCLYFSNSRAKMVGGKPFLLNRGANLGSEKPFVQYNRTPVTYTYIKTRPQGVRWIMADAPIPMDPLPDRPKELATFGPFGSPQSACWTEGSLWMYAGVSPAVPAGCTCPATRNYLDWQKRSFVPEAYRRSIGILDTNGNLIMHLGRYGNFDDALKAQKGSSDIPLTLPRFISGTDNYLAFDDWGEKLVVLKLTYHAQESVPVKTR